MAVLTLKCTKNITVSSLYTTQSYSGNRLAFGRGSQSDEYRLLLGFDSISAVPEGCTISSAKLIVPKTTGALGSNASFEAQAARLTSSFTTSAKWESGNPSFTETGAATADTGTGHSGNITFDVTAIVQAWYTGTAQHGIVLRKAKTGGIHIKVAADKGAYITVTYAYNKSTLTASNGTLDTAQTLTINRNDSSFKHKIKYTCGDVTGYAAGSASAYTDAVSIQWTPPLSLAAENTEGTAVSVTLTLYTYTSGGKDIGNVSKTVSMAIPSSVKPSCSIAVTDDAGHADTYGNPIKGLSRLKVTITPTLSHGSEIASYSTTVNGATYTTAEFTTDALKTAGTNAIKATVKDKRGRSGTATVNVEVLDYNAPVISSLSVHRCDADGTANEEGDHVQVILSALVTPLNNKNTATYTVKHKKTSESSFTSEVIGALANVYTAEDYSFIFAADTGSVFDIQVVVADAFNTTTKGTSVSTAFTLMHWTADGTGMAVGGIGESGKFISRIPAEFHGNGIPVTIGDTGWNAMGFTDAVSASGSNYGRHENGDCYYRVINNNHVYVAFNCAFSYTGSAIYVNANQIPAEYRPKRNVYTMCAVGGRTMARIVVTSTGHVVIDWVQVISAGAATTSATVNWMDAYIDYWIE